MRRLHITLDDALVHEIDRRAGPRRRSAFIAELIRRGIETSTDRDDIDGGNPQTRDGAGMP
jgi:metal-responsive CopG/Arc/MetJ family transcriptional regulator